MNLKKYIKVNDEILKLGFKLLPLVRKNDFAQYLELLLSFIHDFPNGYFTLSELEKSIKTPNKNEFNIDFEKSLNIVHFCTFIGKAGGHSRLIKAWIKTDKNNTHHIVTTKQSKIKIPNFIKDETVIELSKNYTSDVLKTVLKHSEADIIIIHNNVDDPKIIYELSLLEKLPTTIYMNQADHHFWLGNQLADLYVNARKIAQELNKKYRNITKNELLPLPYWNKKEVLTKSEAREKLSLDLSKTIAVTMGSPYKYFPLRTYNFLRDVISVHKKEPFKLLWIGITKQQFEFIFKQKIPDFIELIEEQEDISPFLYASDFLIESFPGGGGYSSLEAAFYNLPICPSYQKEDSVFTGINFLHRDFKNPLTVEDWRELILKLIRDKSFREKGAEKNNLALKEKHSGQVANLNIQTIYRKAYENSFNRNPINPTQPEREMTFNLLLAEHFNQLDWKKLIKAFYTRFKPYHTINDKIQIGFIYIKAKFGLL